MATYPEVSRIVAQLGRPDDGTDTAGFYNSEYFRAPTAQKDWPALVEQTGWRRWIYGRQRPRTKEELVSAMNAELEKKIPGVVWNFSQNIRDNVMESLSGVKGDNSVKIFGPDLDELEKLAAKVKNVLQQVQGVENVGIFHIRGQSHLEFRVDPEKCQRWGVTTADVNNVVSSVLGAQALSSMVEGEKLFDIAIRWPKWRRDNETSILDIPVDIINNQVVQPQGLELHAFRGRPCVCRRRPPVGSRADTTNPISSTPRLRLRDLVSPVGEDCAPNPSGQFVRAGASDIYREDGKRMIAVKFSVRGRDLGGAVAEARAQTQGLFQVPYRSAWSGEFEEMEDAEGRLMIIVPLALGLIFLLLYYAFRSFLDTIVVLTNVFGAVAGRHLGFAADRHEFQHLGRGRFCFDFRRGHHGWAVIDIVFQPHAGPGFAGSGSDHARCRKAGASGDDDSSDGHPGAIAGGLIDPNWRPNGAAAGHRGGRRDDGDAVPDALLDACAV